MFSLLVYQHNLSPFIFEIGSFGIRWYSLMYIIGFSFAYCFYKYILTPRQEMPVALKDLSDLIIYAFLGLLIGARTVYMVFYNTSVLLQDPLSFFQVWNGGLSFHGGLIGVIIALSIFLKQKKLPILYTADRLILPIPLTLFFGRIGNFINGELYGKPVDPSSTPFCVVFPTGGDVCRIPSQLLEAVGEGLLLFAVLLFLFFKVSKKPNGAVFSAFLIGYGIVRFLIEYVREPDAQIGLLWSSISMGQLLSLPMILAGLVIVIYSFRKQQQS